MLKKLTGLLAIVAVCAVPTNTYPDERNFTFSYEPKTLPKGGFEIEEWLTLNGRKVDPYEKWYQRTELEYGITDKLTTSLYFNFEREIGGDGGKNWFDGISSEWKYKLTDPTVNSIGSLLYFEWRAGHNEFELEEKLVLGKNIGRWSVAYNMVAETEYKLPHFVTPEIEWKNTFGISYRINPNWGVGIEALHSTVFPADGEKKTGFFVGPNIHYATEKWWATLTFMPQISGKPANSAGLELDEHTRFMVGLIVGISF